MKRSDNIAWSQVKIGIFIVCALIFLAGGILIMGRQTKMFTDKGEVSVMMADAAGLKVGAPVWLAGVDVGTVTRIRFERPRENNEVEIELEVDREALKKIGPDSIITIKTRGLMGEKYVDVTPSRVYSEAPAKRLYGTPVAKLDDVVAKAGTAFDQLNQIIGSKFIMMASAGKVQGLDGWKTVAERLNQAAGKLKPQGLRTGYHNHNVAPLNKRR
jgi:phospholipid/cholesterol/gamma-HCH transport system substrate-binding protein